MMNMFLGEEVFRKSVSNYLKAHRYNNAAQDDLWEALTQTAHSTGALDSNVTVKMIMDSWTLQTGYPLITVKRDYRRNSVTISQVSCLLISLEIIYIYSIPTHCSINGVIRVYNYVRLRYLLGSTDSRIMAWVGLQYHKVKRER